MAVNFDEAVLNARPAFQVLVVELPFIGRVRPQLAVSAEGARRVQALYQLKAFLVQVLLRRGQPAQLHGGRAQKFQFIAVHIRHVGDRFPGTHDQPREILFIHSEILSPSKG